MCRQTHAFKYPDMPSHLCAGSSKCSAFQQQMHTVGVRSTQLAVFVKHVETG